MDKVTLKELKGSISSEKCQMSSCESMWLCMDGCFKVKKSSGFKSQRLAAQVPKTCV